MHFPVLPVNRKVVEQYGKNWTQPAHFVGNGAFRLSQWVVNEKVVVERNPQLFSGFARRRSQRRGASARQGRLGRGAGRGEQHAGRRAGEREIARLVEDENTEDAQRQGASLPLDKPYLETSPWALWRKRSVWLLMLFVAEAYTGNVLKAFEDQLEAAIALAFFIPLLIGTGGNSGTQITSTLVRAMALGEVSLRNLGAVIRKGSDDLAADRRHHWPGGLGTRLDHGRRHGGDVGGQPVAGGDHRVERDCLVDHSDAVETSRHRSGGGIGAVYRYLYRRHRPDYLFQNCPAGIGYLTALRPMLRAEM